MSKLSLAAFVRHGQEYRLGENRDSGLARVGTRIEADGWVGKKNHEQRFQKCQEGIEKS